MQPKEVKKEWRRVREVRREKEVKERGRIEQKEVKSSYGQAKKIQDNWNLRKRESIHIIRVLEKGNQSNVIEQMLK